MSVEWDILLLCSRISLNDSELECLQDLSRLDVDWQALLDMAAFHRTFPLVYRQIKKHCTLCLPQQLLDSAKSHFRCQGIENLTMASVLLKVLAALEESGVHAVPFKGPVFTKSIFGDLSLRNFCDLDILISVEDLPSAVAIIQKEGFIPLFPLTNNQLKELAKTDNEYPLYEPVKRITIDLQWELVGGYSPQPFYLNALAPHLRSFNFLGKTITVFGKEDLLVYLCIHGNQHAWEQLDQVCCVAETIRTSQDLDWKLVWSRAEELRVNRMIRIGLLLASTLLTSELPADVTSTIRLDRQAVVLAEGLEGKLAQSFSTEVKGLVSRRFVLYHWKSLDSPWQVLRYGCHIFFVPTRYDWQKLPLPAWMSPLHYIYRPLRLVYTGIKNFLTNG